MENNLSAMRSIDKYTLFREKYPVFYYRGFDIEATQEEILLTFRLAYRGFRILRPSGHCLNRKTRSVISMAGIFRRLVFSLGLVELISYWKIACPPKVMIECGKIGKKQVMWVETAVFVRSWRVFLSQ